MVKYDYTNEKPLIDACCVWWDIPAVLLKSCLP